jgi:hypothetical protein
MLNAYGGDIPLPQQVASRDVVIGFGADYGGDWAAVETAPFGRLTTTMESPSQWDKSKTGKGKYIVIYNAIKREFGAKWDLVPEEKFPELADYLKQRILNSKLGRIKNSRGEKCFSSWEEWLTNRHGLDRRET